jgi:NAD(P)-dependent dehydrogenase (short-subunit alcohol dehydrogenase family)
LAELVLQGRGVILAGANRGLGRAIAEACVDAGAHVLISARDEQALDETRTALAARGGPDRIIVSKIADVSRRDEVDALVEEAGRVLPRVDGLVNVAGIYGPLGLVEDVDWDEWVRAIEINLLGTVLLCRAVLPRMRAQGYGKIVNLSGGGATAPLPRFSAYAASKAAVVRFTETLAHEAADAGIDVNAVAPGALNTRLLDQVLEAGPDRVGEDFYQRAKGWQQSGGTPLSLGAELCVFLLSAQSDGVSGRLIAAQWDPWRTLPDRREELAKGEIYTLRRIVPSDRGADWG